MLSQVNLFTILIIIGLLMGLPSVVYAQSLFSGDLDEAKMKIDELILDLRDDDEYYNAVGAVKIFYQSLHDYRQIRSEQQIERLRQRNNERTQEIIDQINQKRKLMEYFEQQLFEALDSDDWQQRQMVAFILKDIEIEPTESLCEVMVEALIDDQMPYWVTEARVYRTYANAYHGFIYLSQNNEECYQHLLIALNSDDWQQQFLACVLLGIHGYDEPLDKMVSILVDNLKDDSIRQNAKLAATALYQLGEDVLDFIPSDDQLDAQQQAIIELIKREWADDYGDETYQVYLKTGFNSYIGDTDYQRNYEFRLIDGFKW